MCTCTSVSPDILLSSADWTITPLSIGTYTLSGWSHLQEISLCWYVFSWNYLMWLTANIPETLSNSSNYALQLPFRFWLLFCSNSSLLDMQRVLSGLRRLSWVLMMTSLAPSQVPGPVRWYWAGTQGLYHTSLASLRSFQQREAEINKIWSLLLYANWSLRLYT